MKVAFSRIYTKNNNLEYNFNCVKNMFEEAVKQGVELLIFPRLAINGLDINIKKMVNEKYIDEYYNIMDKIVNLTYEKNCAILIGDIYIKENEIYNNEYYDSVFFIYRNNIKKIISRKTILKNNIFDDYKLFDKSNVLENFLHNKKKFNILINDDIFYNFNLILASDQKPNYIICLDTSNYDEKFKTNHLIKLAKFANCPIFYLNSANYYNNKLQFNGEIILINENFENVYSDLYKNDNLFIFSIDNEDGSEIILDNNNKIINKNNIFIIKKEFQNLLYKVDCANFNKESLINIKNNIENVLFIKFSDDVNNYDWLENVRLINIKQYINNEFFNTLNLQEKNDIKNIILNNL